MTILYSLFIFSIIVGFAKGFILLNDNLIIALIFTAIVIFIVSQISIYITNHFDKTNLILSEAVAVYYNKDISSRNSLLLKNSSLLLFGNSVSSSQFLICVFKYYINIKYEKYQ